MSQQRVCFWLCSSKIFEQLLPWNLPDDSFSRIQPNLAPRLSAPTIRRHNSLGEQGLAGLGISQSRYNTAAPLNFSVMRQTRDEAIHVIFWFGGGGAAKV